METLEKLQILSGAARYDASCASSGSRRQDASCGTGNTSQGGICHSWSDDGRCISLLKILLSNDCIYDCAYCVNRATNPVPRASFSAREVVELTMEFYRRNYIEGLFLSSAVMQSPDHTMERMVGVAELLRTEERFGGYIHLKIIPGSSSALVRKAGLYADRISVNIELPSQESLRRLAPQKHKQAILEPMSLIGRQIQESMLERKASRHAPRFAPAGQSTQMIIGASPESDLQILRLSEGLYRKMHLKRVYYSAFVPVNADNRLPVLASPPLLREHRLYQADWLLRFYGFSAGEILSDDAPNLDETFDPKTSWALRHPEFFPVEINRADYGTLLRVPGIGVTSARRIVAARRFSVITPEGLKRIGVVMKRAKYFITCSGRPFEKTGRQPELLRSRLLIGDGAGESIPEPPPKQLSLPGLFA
ncbi:MAG: putative DNA modification/repair radical SAM protein [Chlorobium sp.]|uniref:putative DNA modification/repair radical SAM protein n=1 Tax=Chlorobium sp. TaxID=1095 RepID=UPI0025BF00B0|nr:putative DNA modification/repair radical SAM protein [Chlorobium sp.]MCF8383926.1 putative DNA modification/repair radical SAM protein [Chlorobium sp.]